MPLLRNATDQPLVAVYVDPAVQQPPSGGAAVLTHVVVQPGETIEITDTQATHYVGNSCWQID